VLLDGESVGQVKWGLVGEHNMHNGLMAIAAARHVGVAPADAADALGSFVNARRRLELRGEAHGVKVYDDFAHHPTAILATLAALRSKVGGTARIIAVLEPRSNTMKMGICKDDLAPSLGRADEVFLLQPQHIPWQVAEVADACVVPCPLERRCRRAGRDDPQNGDAGRSHSGDEQWRIWRYSSEIAGWAGEESRSGRRVIVLLVVRQYRGLRAVA
jgi:UDP-N-acetylmuramate:L-alanyl-gamma-D-glutamyl-meso-diaminopimelate ligase